MGVAAATNGKLPAPTAAGSKTARKSVSDSNLASATKGPHPSKTLKAASAAELGQLPSGTTGGRKAPKVVISAKSMAQQPDDAPPPPPPGSLARKSSAKNAPAAIVPTVIEPDTRTVKPVLEGHLINTEIPVGLAPLSGAAPTSPSNPLQDAAAATMVPDSAGTKSAPGEDAPKAKKPEAAARAKTAAKAAPDAEKAKEKAEMKEAGGDNSELRPMVPVIIDGQIKEPQTPAAHPSKVAATAPTTQLGDTPPKKASVKLTAAAVQAEAAGLFDSDSD